MPNLTIVVTNKQLADARYLGVDLETQIQDLLAGNTTRTQERRLGVVKEKLKLLPTISIDAILTQLEAQVDPKP